MENQKNLLKVKYIYILILKKLPRFSQIIPIIDNNFHPAAFVPYESSGWVNNGQLGCHKIFALKLNIW